MQRSRSRQCRGLIGVLVSTCLIGCSDQPDAASATAPSDPRANAAPTAQTPVTQEAIEAARVEVAHEEGLLLCPEGAATYAGYKQALADGRVGKDESAVLFNCATGLKYPMPTVDNHLDRHQPIDYASL